MEHLLSQDELHKLRAAAEAAWGDDTRNEQYIGDPQPSAGQCYVTAHWLVHRLGGTIGTKDGHFFWVSPDRQHVLDLTGDQFAYGPADLAYQGIKQDDEDEGWIPTEDQTKYRPGPVVYVRANHPLYKDFRAKDSQDIEDAKNTNFGLGQRLDRFYTRADMAYNGEKVADLIGDSHPAEEPQAIADREQRYWHDEPDYQPEEKEYKFYYGNGQLHISPDHTHEDLAGHAGVSADYTGPQATGYVSVRNNAANWSVIGNIALQGFARILRDYTKQVGWKWGGMTDIDGEPINDDFAPKKSMWYVNKGDHLYISESYTAMADYANSAPRDIKKVFVQGKTAMINGRDTNSSAISALQEWADDQGFKLAEYPGVGEHDVTDRDKTWEDLSEYNTYSPKPSDWPPKTDKPISTFRCEDCGAIFPNAYLLKKHQGDEHQSMPRELDTQDGKFPPLPNMDVPLPDNFMDRKPFVFPLARKEAARVDGFDLYADVWNLEEDGTRTFYGAFLNGSPVGFGSLTNEGEIEMVVAAIKGKGIGSAIIEKMKQHKSELWSHTASSSGEKLLMRQAFAPQGKQLYKWAQGKEPKDMLHAHVPFIYDVENDQIVVGHPGQHHGDIQGVFSPGGIVEGTYEPGGKVVLRTVTDMQVTPRHLLDLWYWEYPHMKVTSLEMEDASGNTTKLAAQSVGRYLKTLALADPAVWNAYQALRKAGGQVYVVGGAVRDALLQREPKDIDLLVSGINSEGVRAALQDTPGKVDLTGKDFGVFRYRNKGSEVEIALPRTERSTGDRRVDFDVQVDHTMPVEKDLERRDFTVNSMAVNLDTGKLVDPYDGAKDINERRLRTTHSNSFREDPTRLVRALVASSRHGLQPDEQTRSEIAANRGALDGESKERIQAELDKLFASPNPAGAIRLAQGTGLLKHILPDLAKNFDFDQNNKNHRYTLGEHSLNVLDNLSRESNDPDLRLAALLHDIGKPGSAWTNPETGYNHYYKGPEGQGANHELVGSEQASGLLRSLKYPVARINRVSDLIKHHMFPAFSTERGARRFLNRVGEHADDLLTLRAADQTGKGQTPEELASRTSVDTQRALLEQVRSKLQPTQQSHLAINGHDLISLGISPGPDLGRILRQLTNDVVEDPQLNERETLLQRAREYHGAT